VNQQVRGGSGVDVQLGTDEEGATVAIASQTELDIGSLTHD